MILQLILLAVGFVMLVKGADWFVSGAVCIADRFHIPPIIIGLTIVAMGTSCPELAVSTSDSIATLLEGGNANVAIGNVVGCFVDYFDEYYCNICSESFNTPLYDEEDLPVEEPEDNTPYFSLGL